MPLLGVQADWKQSSFNNNKDRSICIACLT